MEREMFDLICFIGFVIVFMTVGLFLWWKWRQTRNFMSQVYYLPNPPPEVGPLAPNDYLSQPFKLLEGQIKGPNSILVEGNIIYTGTADGRVLKIENGHILKSYNIRDENGERNGSWSSEPTFGRPMGIRRLNGDCLLIVDAYSGVYKLDTTRESITHILCTSSKACCGEHFVYMNDLDVLDEKTFFVTNSATCFARRQHTNVMLENAPTGKIIEVKVWSGEHRILLDHLFYPYGLQIHPDKQSILYSEAVKCRIMRHYFAGEKMGKLEAFATNLPGVPSNIRLSSDQKTFIVGMMYSRFEGKKAPVDVLGPHANVRRWMVSLIPDWVLPHVGKAISPKKGVVVELDLDGHIVRSYQDPKGTIKLRTMASTCTSAAGTRSTYRGYQNWFESSTSSNHVAFRLFATNKTAFSTQSAFFWGGARSKRVECRVNCEVGWRNRGMGGKQTLWSDVGCHSVSQVERKWGSHPREPVSGVCLTIFGVTLVVFIVQATTTDYTPLSAIVTPAPSNEFPGVPFEENKQVVVHVEDKNHIVSPLYLEDLYNVTNMPAKSEMNELSMKLAVVSSTKDVRNFYRVCAQNLRKIGPNLRVVHFGQGGNTLTSITHEIDQLVSDVEVVIEELTNLGFSVDDISLISEVVITDPVLNVTALAESLGSNVTLDQMSVYGIPVERNITSTTFRWNIVFSSLTLFRDPTDQVKFGQLLMASTGNKELGPRRRLEQRLDQRCVRPLTLNSMLCVAEVDRMQVSRRTSEGVITFCCDFRQ